MSDDNLIPISDEQAKLGQQILQTGRDLGGYVAGILDDLPKDLVGLVAGDRVKAARKRRLGILEAKTKKLLQDQGIAEPESPSLKLALPIFEAAADEDNQELQDLWARLLAAAMDPKRRDLVRQSFIPIVKQMEAFDVAVLKIIAANPHMGQWATNGLDVIVESLQRDSSQDLRNDVRVSFESLAKLGCTTFSDTEGHSNNPYLTPFGTLLMRAVSG
jgi:Abortive infection alpha